MPFQKYTVNECRDLRGKYIPYLWKWEGNTIQRETTIKLQGKSLIVMGKIVDVTGEPYNLFRENL